MDPPLAARLPLEVLDGVRDVGRAPVDPGPLERLVEQRPAGPTNGCPARSSWSPGCSPTNITAAPSRPSPKTVCVAVSQRGQRAAARAASRSFGGWARRACRPRAVSARHASAVPSVGGYKPSPPSRMLLLRMVVRPTRISGCIAGRLRARRRPELVESYRRLADVFHEVLAEQSLDALLVRIADTLARADPARHADDLRGRRGARDAEAGARPRRVRRRDHAHDAPLRRGDHRLGGEPPRGGAREPGAPRPARPLRPRHADRPGGADLDPADRPRADQGRAQHLPRSARTRRSPRRSSSSRSGSPTPRRSRSTTRRSARGSSTRRAPTR